MKPIPGVRHTLVTKDVYTPYRQAGAGVGSGLLQPGGLFRLPLPSKLHNAGGGSDG